MARVEINEVCFTTRADGAIVPAANKLVTVRVRSTNALATVYAAETGVTTKANPLTSGPKGELDGWIDEGSYLLEPGGGLAPIPYEASLGGASTGVSQSALDAVKAGAQGYVNHGAIAGTARPAGYAAIEWIGSVQPTNMIDGDTWIDTSKVVSVNDRDHKQPGMYAVGALPATTNTKTAVANQAELSRFVPSRAMTIATIAFVVETAASIDDAVDVGIYDAAGNRLASSGAVLGQLNSVGVKNIGLTGALTLAADTVYYAAWACGAIGGTAAVYAAISRQSSNVMTMFGGNMPQLEGALKAASHPLPATIVAPTARFNQPLLALRE